MGLKWFYPRLMLGTFFACLSLGKMTFPARAEIPRINLMVFMYEDTSYEALLQEAESLAREAIERQFAEEAAAEEVQVIILGARNGQVTPILSVQVSRSAWRENPTISDGAQYFAVARSLLIAADRQVVAQAPSLSTAQPAVTVNGQPAVTANPTIQASPPRSSQPVTLPTPQVNPNLPDSVIENIPGFRDD